jgi:hypothetical protein
MLTVFCVLAACDELDIGKTVNCYKIELHVECWIGRRLTTLVTIEQIESKSDIETPLLNH